MISVKFKSTDVKRLLKKSPDSLGRALEGAVNDIAALALRELTEYPSEPPNSSYTRTLTLMRSWAIERSGVLLQARAIVGSNENIAPYNRFVQAAGEQARIHAGRWPTDESVS